MFRRLFPAAHAAAAIAAIAHVLSLAYFKKVVGLLSLGGKLIEVVLGSLYIAMLTYILTFAAAIP